MRRLILTVGAALVAVGLAAGSAGSATSKSIYLVFSELSTTASGSGATIETELAGSFDAGAKAASGSGEYESAAIGDGTFSLTRLIAFQSYGCGYIGDVNLGDATLCGGRVILAVHFVPDVGVPFD